MKRQKRRGFVMAMINFSTLDEQVKTIWVLAQLFDRHFCHFFKRRFFCFRNTNDQIIDEKYRILPVKIVLHVSLSKEANELFSIIKVNLI